MFGREVERRENVPVILDLGPVGDGVAQRREKTSTIWFLTIEIGWRDPNCSAEPGRVMSSVAAPSSAIAS